MCSNQANWCWWWKALKNVLQGCSIHWISLIPIKTAHPAHTPKRFLPLPTVGVHKVGIYVCLFGWVRPTAHAQNSIFIWLLTPFKYTFTAQNIINCSNSKSNSEAQDVSFNFKVISFLKDLNGKKAFMGPRVSHDYDAKIATQPSTGLAA